MALDSKWISIPLPVTQTRDKAQSNLAPYEARTLFDIDVEQSRGSLTMRRGHKQIFDLPPSSGKCAALAEYERDGTRYIVALVSSEGGVSKNPYERRSDGGGTWQPFYISRSLDGDVDLSVQPNEVRLFGSDIWWRGNVKAKSLQRFHRTDDVTANPVMVRNEFVVDDWGIQIIPWDAVAVPGGLGYQAGRYVWWAASIVMDNGQETPLGAITDPKLTMSGNISRFTLQVHIPNGLYFTRRAKAIRIYASQNRTLSGDPLVAQTFYLIREIGIYDNEAELRHNGNRGWLERQAQKQPGYILFGGSQDANIHHAEEDVQNGSRLMFGPAAERAQDFAVRVTRVTSESGVLRLDYDPSQEDLVRSIFENTFRPDRERRRGRNPPTYRAAIRLWHQWSTFLTDDNPSLRDYNIFIEDGDYDRIKRYYDYTLIGQAVRNISPLRRHAKLASDRAFYWKVTDDEDVEDGRRLYYSHFNGAGLHAQDIVPPANNIEFPFNVLGLVEVGTHRIVVGDIGYAVGFMRGSVKDQWEIYQGKTRVGCISEKSLAETPFGAVFLGYDGIYIVASLQYQGPYGLGIFREIETHPNLTKAIGGYSQQGMRYYLYIPGVVVEHGGGQKTKTVPSKFYCIDLNSEDKRVRELSAPDLDDIHIFGFGLDGTALFATEDGIFRSEELPGETDFWGTPKPEVETGFIRILQGDKHQQITAIALDYVFVTFLEGAKIQLTVTGYQNGIETTVSLPPSTGGKLQAFKLPVPKDLAHSIRLRTVDDAGHTVHPTKFTVNAIQVLTGEADGTL